MPIFLCRVRYKLSYRDVAELFWSRGFQFTHETVRDWEERFLPYFIEQIRTKRKGKVGKVWLVDETFIRVKRRCCYLYRAIDENGNLVDVRLSKTRDMAGTKAFFPQAIGLHEDSPEKVATDGLAPYPRAITEELGKAPSMRCALARLILWSRAIGESIIATTQRLDLESLRRLNGSAERWMKWVIFGGRDYILQISCACAITENDLSNAIEEVEAIFKAVLSERELGVTASIFGPICGFDGQTPTSACAH